MPSRVKRAPTQRMTKTPAAMREPAHFFHSVLGVMGFRREDRTAGPFGFSVFPPEGVPPTPPLKKIPLGATPPRPHGAGWGVPPPSPHVRPNPAYSFSFTDIAKVLRRNSLTRRHAIPKTGLTYSLSGRGVGCHPPISEKNKGGGGGPSGPTTIQPSRNPGFSVEERSGNKVRFMQSTSGYSQERAGVPPPT
jgi:hypothetical protein